MIERATSYRRVKALAPDWDLIVSDKVYYLVEMEGDEDIGVIAFHPCDVNSLMMHVELGEKCRGKRAVQAYKNAFDWMFANTDVEKLIGRIPKEYKHARVMARHVGAMFDEIDVDGLVCYSVTKNEMRAN